MSGSDDDDQPLEPQQQQQQHLSPIQKLVFDPKSSPHLSRQVIQALWKGYGHITRIAAPASFENNSSNSTTSSDIVVKTIVFPAADPADVAGHDRKVKSYIVEMGFYKHVVPSLGGHKKVQVAELFECGTYQQQQQEGESSNRKAADPIFYLALEDLSTAGFPLSVPREAVPPRAVTAVLRWLANFHAITCFEKSSASSSPPSFAQHVHSRGSYWHLETRQSELGKLPPSSPLKLHAVNFDTALVQRCSHLALLHGDVKGPNFCCADNFDAAAAVDFQYVGFGCPAVDVACFAMYVVRDEESVKPYVEEYSALVMAALAAHRELLSDKAAERIAEEWCTMFPVACADYIRFYCGWKPGTTLESRPMWQQKMVAMAVEMVSM